MEQKTKTYLLLTIVLIVWCTVAYNIYYWINGNTVNEVADTINTSASFKRKKIRRNDDFTLHIHERDPFLGTIKNKKVIKPSIVTRPVLANNVPKIEIAYSGMVKRGTSKGESIYFIRINGIQHLMHIGEMVSKVKLIKGEQQHITVVVGDKRRIIKK